MRVVLAIAVALSWSIGFSAGAGAGQHAAPDVANRFLAGIESRDPSERGRLLDGLRWNTASFEYPAFDRAAVVLAGWFDTDVDGVRGYESVVQLRTMLRPGVPLMKTYRLVAYADRLSGRWRVWAFQEWSDTAAGLASWRARLAVEGDPAVRLLYAHYLSAYGRLNEALDQYAEVAAGDPRHPDLAVVQNEANASVQDLRRIIGK